MTARHRNPLVRRIAENIRDRRIALGWSQEKFAEKASLHRTYVGSVERGERNISAENIEKIAIAIGLEPSELLEKKKHREDPDGQ